MTLGCCLHVCVILWLILAVMRFACIHALLPHDFLRARNMCFQREHLPASYARSFDKFEFPNEPIVHRYLHCLWSRELNLFNDVAGFDASRIVQIYGGDRVNDEVAVPIISNCNQQSRALATTVDGVLSSSKWCYSAFVCILESRVGQWYKRSTSDIINGNF